MPSHIDPTQIPGDNLDPDTVDASALQMRTIGSSVTNQGAAVHTAWQAIAASYKAPESATLFGVMDPVPTNATEFGSSLGRVADALNEYTEAVRPIKAQLAQLKAEASAFVSSIANGVSHTSYSRAGATTSTESWDKDQASVDKNNGLINDVNAQMVLLWAAERACANKIYDTIGWSHISAATNSNPNGYGVDKIPDGTKMPWGADVKRTESCGEKAADAVGHFVWNGVIVDGLWGTVKGLGTLILGYNPQNGTFFQGSTYGAAWSNLGMLGVGLATTSPMGAGLALVPGPVGKFVRKGQNTLLQAGKGLIAYDEWSKDPATAAGTAVFNVGTILLPGGAEVDGVKTGGSVAAAALRGAGKVAELTDPVSVLLKTGTTGMKIAMPAISDLAKTLSGSLHLGDVGDLGKIDMPKIDIPVVTDHNFDFGTGADAGSVHAGSVHSGSDAGGVGGQFDIPPVHAAPVHLTDVHVTSDAPLATVSAGTHEPALVGAGGTATHTIEHGGEAGGVTTTVGGHGGDVTTSAGGHGGDASTSAGGHGDTPTGSGDTPTGHDGGGTAAGSDGGHPWSPSDGDPALSHADHGDGWTRVDGERGNPIDPSYGQPLADHGHLADQYAPPPIHDVPEPVRSLVHDPGAPYGRDAAGDPYTRAEWEERYVGPDNRPIYPGNDGAVPGTRIDFTSVDEFQAHYGTLLDRMGSDRGDFMSFPDTPFEERGLPGSNLSAPYSTLELTGHLPSDVKIEVSEVAPAFGQPGGGLQVRFIDTTTGSPIPVSDLVSGDSSVLTHVAPDAGLTPHYTDATTSSFVTHESLVSHDSPLTVHDAAVVNHDAGTVTPAVAVAPHHGVAVPASDHSVASAYVTDAGARVSDLSTAVPGGHLAALHATSADPSVLKSVFNHEYPAVVDVNAARAAQGIPGHQLNCTRCVIATDHTLDGTPAAAMPVIDPKGAPVTDITEHFGRSPADFTHMGSYSDIVSTMDSLPEGARGIVFGQRSTIGHVFNVVHDKNGIVFIDGQTGSFAHLKTYDALWLFVTKAR